MLKTCMSIAHNILDERLFDFALVRVGTFINSHEELLLRGESNNALSAGFDIAAVASTPTESPVRNEL